MKPAFIDSNIIVYHLAGNHPRFSPRSTALVQRLSRGEEAAVCTSTAVIEASFVIERVLRVPRSQAAPALRNLVSISAIEFDFRQAIIDAIDLWRENGPLSLPDAYHLIFARDAGLDRIYTFDTKMGRYPGVERLEP